MRLTAPPRSTSLSSVLILPIPLAALLVAYLWAVARRPDVPEQAQIEDPHAWGFPSWYGSGPTPYDHGAVGMGHDDDGVCEHPQSVLLFIDLPADSPRMPSALSTLAALYTSQRFLPSAISPLSPGWNTSRSVVDNLRSAGCARFDWIWRIGSGSKAEMAPGDLKEACRSAVWVNDGSSMGVADVTLLSSPDQLLAPGNSAAALKHAHGDDWEMGLLAHVVPARGSGKPSVVYFPEPTTPRTQYPKLPWGKTWSIYAGSGRPVLPIGAKQDPFAPGIKSRWLSYWNKEQARLARAMRQADICVFEGWHRGRLDERAVEAMLSGCVVAMVPPKAHHDLLSPVILPLPAGAAASDKPELPVDQVQAVLAVHGPPAIKRKAVKGFIAARQRFTPGARLRAVEDVVQVWKDGGRGYHFSHGFRWDCAPGSEGPWCGGSQLPSAQQGL
ncbi:hypothetical protein IAU60_002564 [Kwoniella sp. DSM 27419]